MMADFGVLQCAVDAGFSTLMIFSVAQDRLELRFAAALGGAAGRIALHHIQFRLTGSLIGSPRAFQAVHPDLLRSCAGQNHPVVGCSCSSRVVTVRSAPLARRGSSA